MNMYILDNSNLDYAFLATIWANGQLSFILKANCPTDKTIAEQSANRSKVGTDLGGRGTEVKWAWI